MPKSGLADLGARTAVHRQPVAALPHDLHGTPRGPGLLHEERFEPGGVRSADGDPGPEPGAGEVGDLLIGDESPLFEGEDPVGGPRGLLGVAGGEQDRAALIGMGPHDPVEPSAFADGQPVGGVVQHDGVRVGQQGAGQAEAAVHAPRQRVQPRVAQADQAHDLQDLVGTPRRQPRGRAQHAQMASDRAGRVTGHVAEEYAHFARGVGDAVQGRPLK